jgi:hypothetical protein
MSERTALILMITCGVSFIVSIISIVIAISNAKRPRFVFVGKDKPETTDIAGQAGEQSTTPGGPTTVTPPELGVRWKGTSPAATGLEADPREIPTPLRPDDVNEGSGAGAVLGGPSQGARRW